MKRREVISLRLWCLFGLAIIGLVAAANTNNTTSPWDSNIQYSIETIDFRPHNGSYMANVYNNTNGQTTSYQKKFSNDTEAISWFQNMLSKLDFGWWWPFG